MGYAKKVKTIDSLHKAMPYILVSRCNSEIYIAEKIDVTNLLTFIKEKNKGIKKEDQVTLFHCFLAGLAKVVYERPFLNRFIRMKKYYERERIILSFIAKSQLEDDAREIIINLKLEETDTLETLKSTILKRVREKRSEKSNSGNKMVDIAAKLPFFSCIAGLYRLADYWGLLPREMIETDPFYATILVTNLGSIKCNQVYHHLNNHGTNSIVVAIGTVHKEEVIYENEKREIRDIVEVGVTCDERIADGFYFAKSIKLFQQIINKPEILERQLAEELNYEV